MGCRTFRATGPGVHGKALRKARNTNSTRRSLNHLATPNSDPHRSNHTYVGERESECLVFKRIPQTTGESIYKFCTFI